MHISDLRVRKTIDHFGINTPSINLNNEGTKGGNLNAKIILGQRK